MKVLVTGSSGFVGRKVAQRLRSAGFSVSRAVRSMDSDGDAVRVGSISGSTDWSEALDGCEAVVHLAARTPGADVTADEFTLVNDLGTARLAEQTRDAGIKKFILMSSIFAVTGNTSTTIVGDLTPTCPVLPYGRSKLAAEAHVAAFAEGGRSGISLRPPLIYGATAKGNWHLLQKLAATGLPLPLGLAANRRSMISIDNLADAVVAAIRGASSENSGAYAVCDNESVSLAQIIGWLREGMKKPARLVPLPSVLLTVPLILGGRRRIAQSLFGDLEIDGSRFRQAFNWSAPEFARDGILRSGREFCAERI